MLSGLTQQGQSLSVSNSLADADGLGLISYTWKDASGNTLGSGSSLNLGPAHVGKQIRVVASYTDGQGNEENVVSALSGSVAALPLPPPPVNNAPSGSVLLSGSPVQGQVLSVSNNLSDADGNGTVSYAWRDQLGNQLGTGNSLSLSQALVGKQIKVIASYTDGKGNVESVSSGSSLAVANLNDAPSGTVSISGSAKVGQTLRASHNLSDADGLGSISYTWKNASGQILGSGPSFLLEAEDAGQSLQVEVSYTDAFGQAEKISSAFTAAVLDISRPEGSLRIDGSGILGTSLHANADISDPEGLGTLFYTWKDQAGTVLGTGRNLLLDEEMASRQISVTASYVDGAGNTSSIDSGRVTTASSGVKTDEPWTAPTDAGGAEGYHYTGNVSLKDGTVILGEADEDYFRNDLVAYSTLGIQKFLKNRDVDGYVRAIDATSDGGYAVLTEVDMGNNSEFAIQRFYADGSAKGAAVSGYSMSTDGKIQFDALDNGGYLINGNLYRPDELNSTSSDFSFDEYKPMVLENGNIVGFKYHDSVYREDTGLSDPDYLSADTYSDEGLLLNSFKLPGSNPKILLSLADNGFLISFQSSEGQNYIQAFKSDGSSLAQAFSNYNELTGSQLFEFPSESYNQAQGPKLIALADGSLLYSKRSDGEPKIIDSQKYSLSGEKLGPIVQTRFSNDASEFVVTALPDGGFVIRKHNDNTEFVLHQADDTPDSMRLSYDESSRELDLGSYGFVKTYSVYNQLEGRSHLMLQRFDIEGNKIGESELVSASDSFRGLYALNEGKSLAVWRQGVSYGIHAQIFAANGKSQGSEFSLHEAQLLDSLKITELAEDRVLITLKNEGFLYLQIQNLDGKLISQSSVDVSSRYLIGKPVVLEDGGFWLQFKNENDGSISFQRFDASGIAQGNAISLASNDEFALTSAFSLPQGGFAIASEEAYDETSSSEAYLDIYSTSGSLLHHNLLEARPDEVTPIFANDGSFTLVYVSEYYNPGLESSDERLTLHKFNASGESLEILSHLASIDDDARFIPLRDGGFAAAWGSLAQRFDLRGEAYGSLIRFEGVWGDYDDYNDGPSFSELADGQLRLSSNYDGQLSIYTEEPDPGQVTWKALYGPDLIQGTDNSDLVNNISAGDEIRGGRGNDRFEIVTSDFVLVDGQAGSDTLAFVGNLDLRSVDDAKIKNIEEIALSPGQLLTLRVSDLIAMTDADAILSLSGSGQADIGSGWTKGSSTQGFTSYFQSGATLKIQDTVDIAGVNDPLRGGLTISGDGRVGSTLTLSSSLTDADGLGTVTYTWKDQNGLSLGTGTSLTIGTANTLGKKISVSASYTDGHGTAEQATSNAILSATGTVDIVKTEIVEFTENQVNTNFGYKYATSVTHLTDGGFVVTWEADSQDGSGNGVYAQRYAANGATSGIEFRVNSYTNNYQGAPSSTSLADGGFIVTWVSTGQDGSGTGVYAQRYASDGSVSGSEFKINTYTSSDQGAPSVTNLIDGGFIVAWESNGQDGSEYGVYAQRYAANGSANGSEFKVNTYTNSYQGTPSITSLADGGFLVAWNSVGQDGSGSGVYAKRYAANGSAVGNEFKVNTYTTEHQSQPNVTNLADGGFLVTWTSNGQDAGWYDIYAQRYAANGIPSGSEFKVNTYTSSYQDDPSVISLVDGGFLITWASMNQDGSGYGVYAQRYAANGSANGSEFHVNTYSSSDQSRPSVTSLADGGFLFTWVSSSSDQQYGWGGIYAQRYAADGSKTADTILTHLTGSTWTALSGSDTIVGDDKIDQVSAISTGDTVYGRGGDDSFALSSGDFARIEGGEGADTLSFTGTLILDASKISSIEALKGSSGNDNLSFALTVDGASNFGSFTSIDLGAGSDTLNVSLYADFGSFSLTGVEFILGSSGDDSIGGTAGNDNINGGGGNDSLFGSDGNDTLRGGTGLDTLSGGSGSDTFVYLALDIAGTGVDDVLSDFVAGSDKLDFVFAVNAVNSAFSIAGASEAAFLTAAKASSGITTLAANRAVLVTNSSSGDKYLFVNDGTSSFTDADVILKVSGLTGLPTTSDFI